MRLFLTRLSSMRCSSMRLPKAMRVDATQSVLLGALLAALAWASFAIAAEPAAVKSVPTASTAGPFRVSVPGVEVTIPPDRQEEETFATHDIVEILHGIPGLEWKPKLSPDTQTLREMATATVFRRDIWCLELTFKPVRMIWVDVPQASGKMQRKLIWYMVYHVKNTGKHLKPTRHDDGTYTMQTVDRELRFFPQFVLEAQEYNKAYLDRVIPVAVLAIQQREDPKRRLFNSVEISSKPLAVSSDLVDKSVWGVATWEDLEPRTDFFSVYVQGLTNAYQWVDSPQGFKPGDPPGKDRALLQKTLQLNFWRPGDEYVEDQRVIRFGIPGKVDYQWVYR
jgi:hypothetical protein